jgi:hypothetical protein
VGGFCEFGQQPFAFWRQQQVWPLSRTSPLRLNTYNQFLCVPDGRSLGRTVRSPALLFEPLQQFAY